MRIDCCWLYAIEKYGYPPPLGNLYQALSDMRSLGFTHVELEAVGEENLLKIQEDLGGIKAHLAALELSVVNFCPILPDLVSTDEATRRHAQRLFLQALQVARELGAEMVQTDSFAPPLAFVGEVPYKEAVKFGKQFKVKVDEEFHWSAVWEALVGTFRFCAHAAKQAGLKFCLEPRVGETISNTDALLRLMDHVGDSNLGAVLDCGHLHAQKELLPLSVEKLGDRLFYVHVSDNDGRSNEHLAPGLGTVDWEGVFAALKKHQFQGWVGVDVGGVPDLDDQYRRSLIFLQEIEWVVQV